MPWSNTKRKRLPKETERIPYAQNTTDITNRTKNFTRTIIKSRTLVTDAHVASLTRALTRSPSIHAFRDAQTHHNWRQRFLARYFYSWILAASSVTLNPFTAHPFCCQTCARAAAKTSEQLTLFSLWLVKTKTIHMQCNVGQFFVDFCLSPFWGWQSIFYGWLAQHLMYTM